MDSVFHLSNVVMGIGSVQMTAMNLTALSTRHHNQFA